MRLVVRLSLVTLLVVLLLALNHPTSPATAGSTMTVSQRSNVLVLGANITDCIVKMELNADEEVLAWNEINPGEAWSDNFNPIPIGTVNKKPISKLNIPQQNHN